MGNMNATMWFVMRPQAGFEQIYQGEPRTTPLPLFPYQLDEQAALPLESERLRLGYNSHLASYLRVVRGATILMLFPRIQGLYALGFPEEQFLVTQYTYQLRWRQRPLDDAILSKGEQSYSTPNYVQSNVSQRMLVIPCSQGPTFTPAYPANGTLERGLFTLDKQKLVDQQGFYTNGEDDERLSATGYPPEAVRCDGDELGLVMYRGSGNTTWDFAATPLGVGEDFPLSATFGVGTVTLPSGSTFSNNINPGAGVYVAVVQRDTYP